MQDLLWQCSTGIDSINVCRSLVCTEGQATALQTVCVAVEYAALRGVYFSAFYRLQRFGI